MVSYWNMLKAKGSSFYVDSQPRAAVLHPFTSVWGMRVFLSSCTLNAYSRGPCERDARTTTLRNRTFQVGAVQAHGMSLQ